MDNFDPTKLTNADLQPWPVYVCTYTMDGEQWGFRIPARDSDDAQRRLNAIGRTGEVNGQLIAEYKNLPGTGLLVRATVAVRNFFARR